MGKKAVHFGGGNIGRGFVGEFLHESGYEVVFVDVMDSIIDALKNTPSYNVTEISTEGEHTKTVSGYRAINSKHNLDDVVKEIATADVVTCAVGPNILKFIASPIAKGIDARTESKPIAVIACENAIGATDTLHGFIKDNTDASRLESLPSRAQFANSAIDRIVPTQAPDAGLNVKIEKFYEWVVEKTPFASVGHPKIDAIHWVDNLEPYIERKLFTVNTGHATAAYYGYNAGKKTIAESLNDVTIRGRVSEALVETSALIVAKHGISEAEQKEYVNKIVTRISNPYLEDVVERVGRDPLRKLSRKERFIGPAAQLAERGLKVDALLGAIEQALKFQDVPTVDESFELTKILKENSPADATTKLTGLEKDHPLFDRVAERVAKVQTTTK
ncbi:mannitol-1-phosphate 5-dehydrogenase [Polytolypa hystricis UAMH7299]|uniref:Mannitol-1-phosphate 5-dehydrogenase n=1 Tax=Polytolypa hystricis (strain UAMH7299) TaxID=1447883 RepID=A0A2B7YZD9_POLH7|nr:mannitol-1-phosphate 5-dehydrogenase [Polytolypa hystricis UAMH7299]